ncbi:MAG: DUF1572 family protein [Bacteroidia bacterium]|nr:DUF1572 family protein [Bacteroidia bacterium]
MNADYLNSVRKQFEYYKHLGDKTFEQLEPEKLFYKHNDNSNSIAVIIQHLTGNMLSRWTDFLTTDGEKEWRKRDEEFADIENNKTALLQLWEKGWQCLFHALDSLEPQDLSKIIYIRNQGHSVTEAINRQLAHYPYHIGQIVFLGKMLATNEWKSLSIPKNKSNDYNSDKFSKPKERGHFTDEFLKKEKE